MKQAGHNLMATLDGSVAVIVGACLSRTFNTSLLALTTANVWSASLGIAPLAAVLLCGSVVAVLLVMRAHESSVELQAIDDPRWIPLLSVVLCAGGIGLMVLGESISSTWCLLAGFVSAGLGGGYFEVAWGRRFALLDAAAIQPGTLVMIALAGILGIAVSSIPVRPLFYTVLVLLGAASCLLYFKTPAKPADVAECPTAVDDPETRAQRIHALGNILLCYLVFSALYNFVVALTYDFLPTHMASQVRYLANMAIAIVLLSLTYFMKPLSPISIFRLVLPVTAAGFALYLMVPEELVWAPFVISGIGRKLLDILVWVVVAQAVLSYRLHPDRFFGLLLAGKNFGYLFGLLLAHSALGVDSGAVQVAIAAPVLMLALIALFSWVFPERRLEQLFRVAENPVESPDDADGRIERFAAEFGLTPRETEVLALLAKGRTQTVIAHKLGISPGTAHTHILHVYQKTGVGKHQELIELVDSREAR